MFRKIGLIPLVAAASILVIACDPDAAEAPVNNVDTGIEVGNNMSGDNSAAGSGKSAATGEACGGIVPITCGSPKDYCKYPDGQCGAADAPGVCTVKPEVCTQQYDPVCGCDDKTYGNACEAAAAGVSVKAEGECPKPAG